MPALTEARYEALRCAKEAVHVLLARHTRVTGGDTGRTGKSDDLLDLRLSCDQILAAYKRQDVVRGQDVAGVDGSI